MFALKTLPCLAWVILLLQNWNSWWRKLTRFDAIWRGLVIEKRMLSRNFMRKTETLKRFSSNLKLNLTWRKKIESARKTRLKKNFRHFKFFHPPRKKKYFWQIWTWFFCIRRERNYFLCKKFDSFITFAKKSKRNETYRRSLDHILGRFVSCL